MGSKRSHSVSSDSSFNSRCSPFSSSSRASSPFKRGRPRDRIELEPEEILVADLANIFFECAINAPSGKNAERAAKDKDKDTGPLPEVFLNYINSVTGSSGNKDKPELCMKDVIDEELSKVFDMQEENPSDLRRSFLNVLERDEEEEDINLGKEVFYVPVLPPEPCYATDVPGLDPEESSRRALKKYIEEAPEMLRDRNFSFEDYIRYSYPLMYYSYMGDAKEVIEKISSCPASKGSSSICDCYEKESQFHWNPLVVTVCHGNINFIDAIDKAADTNKHLSSLMCRFLSPILNNSGLPFFACENNQLSMLRYLYAKDLNAKYQKTSSAQECVPEIFDAITTTYAFSLPAVAAANKNREMLDFFFHPDCPQQMKESQLSRILLEAVNTDDVEFTKYVLSKIRVFLRSQKCHVNTSGVMRHNVDQRTGLVRDTAFHRAIVRENMEMLTMLREQDGYRAVEELDADGLNPQYFALSVGMKKAFDNFANDSGFNVNHLILSYDIGLNTNQEYLCQDLIESASGIRNHVSYCLEKSIACLNLNITEELVKKILRMADLDEQKKTEVFSDSAILALHTARRMASLRYKSSEVRTQNVKKLTDCVAMLINAGALVPYEYHNSFPSEAAAPDIYEIFRRLMYREGIDGRSLGSCFVPMNVAVKELLEHRLAPIPPEDVPRLRDLRPYLFRM